MAPNLKPPVVPYPVGRYKFVRPVYKVYWLGQNMGVVEKYVVADDINMAKRKARKKWNKEIGPSGVGASILFRKGYITGFYSPPNVDLR